MKNTLLSIIALSLFIADAAGQKYPTGNLDKRVKTFLEFVKQFR
jgi:hypothetical protein